MLQKIILIVLLTTYSSSFLSAQIGGKRAYDFLELPFSARVAGLGGGNISLTQKDASMMMQNPALLEKESSKYLAVNYSSFYAGINYTSLAYAYHFEKAGTFGLSLQYMNYGSMDETDANGQVLGTFKANEFAFGTTYSKKINNYSFGGTIKLIGSQISAYHAYALAFDLGAMFKHPEKDLVFALSINQLGFNLKNYGQASQNTLPFNAQLGVSFRPGKMPFRFSFTLHHLQKWNLAYEQNINGDLEKINFFDQFARHLIFGTELLLHKAFVINFGYNHGLNRELRLQEVTKLAGFSIGFVLKIKAFELTYSRAAYHAAGGKNYLGFRLNTGSLIKKK